MSFLNKCIHRLFFVSSTVSASICVSFTKEASLGSLEAIPASSDPLQRFVVSGCNTPCRRQILQSKLAQPWAVRSRIYFYSLSRMTNSKEGKSLQGVSSAIGWGGCPNWEALFLPPQWWEAGSVPCVPPGSQVRCKEAEMAASGFVLSQVALLLLQAISTGAVIVGRSLLPSFWSGVDYTCLQLCLQTIDISGVCRQGILATVTKIKVGECKAFARKWKNSERL